MKVTVTVQADIEVEFDENSQEFKDLFENLENYNDYFVECDEQEFAEIFNVKDKLPNVECGSYLVYAPKSFPKNSRWLVAEYYDDVKGFYSESSENFLEDVTHWCELPKEPQT